MTHIEQMIKDMCPHGVEFKTLGEVCKIRTGKLNANAQVENGQYPFFTCDATPFRIDTYAFDTEAILVSGNGSQVGHINYYKGKFNAYQRTYVLDCFTNINVFFLLHYLKCRLKKHVMEKSKKGSIPYITLPMLSDFEIPIPPLEIQKKIVECLDKFSALAAELQAELQMRRKQYEYYRTHLLTPHSECNSADKSDDCNWENVKFSDIASYIRGVTYNKHDELHERSDSAIKVLRANNITLESNSLNLDEVKFIRSDVRVKQEQYLRKNDIFICAGSGSKEHVGKVAFINEDMDYTFGGFMGVVRTREKVTSKFLYYILTSNIFKEYLIGALNSTTINNLNNTIMSEFSFMVPSLAEQARIVSILDKFEALTTSLSDGIPAEQAAQQKRYEYYRDKLLTFPMAEK